MNAYDSVLVALDLSEAADQVILRASRLAESLGARLEVVHIVEYLPPIEVGYDVPLPGDWGVDEAALLETGRERLNKLLAAHELADVPVEVVMGDARHEIVRIAEERGCGLVVVGSHGRGGITALLGSTADAVVHHAPCDVLAVRIRKSG